MLNDIIICVLNITIPILMISYSVILYNTARKMQLKKVRIRKLISYAVIILCITRIIISSIIQEPISLRILDIIYVLIWTIVFLIERQLLKVIEFMHRTGVLREFWNQEDK